MNFDFDRNSFIHVRVCSIYPLILDARSDPEAYTCGMTRSRKIVRMMSTTIYVNMSPSARFELCWRFVTAFHLNIRFSANLSIGLKRYAMIIPSHTGFSIPEMRFPQPEKNSKFLKANTSAMSAAPVSPA